MNKKLLRQIPAVNDLLAARKGQNLIGEYSRNQVRKGINRVTDKIRAEIRKDGGTDIDLSPGGILDRVEKSLQARFGRGIKRAINATGVVIHTNLGRSVLSEEACNGLNEIAGGYSTLEIDRDTGDRGSRCAVVCDLLQEITGAGDVYIVNNNAAAVLLALNTLARDREVIISRGELVEIGGSFRIPDVMKKSGGRLVEVGTTNKVYPGDYRQAITEETGLILKVHTSNYRIMGFTAEVATSELAEIGRENNLPVMEDLGSGCLLNLKEYGLSHEPTVGDTLKSGADIVTFSGDKLLGGPQCGILAGRDVLIDKMRNNPLARALRVDKLTLSVLETTLKHYLKEEALTEIPTLRMLTADINVIRKKAEMLGKSIRSSLPAADYQITVEKGYSRVGGGAYPLEELATYIVLLKPEKGAGVEELATVLRRNSPPVFMRITDDSLVFDPRTLLPGDEEVIVKALKNQVNE